MLAMPSTHDRPAGTATRRRALGFGAAAIVASAWPGVATAAHVVKPWPAAKPVPELDLADLEGRRWRLVRMGGQVVVMNFWATWCEPCRLEMPSLEALSQRRRRDGVVVVAVNYREAPELIRSYLERAPFKAPIVLDSDGDATTAWTPRVFPSTVLIGRDGQPTHTVLGELDWGGAEARALIDPMVAMPRAGARGY